MQNVKIQNRLIGIDHPTYIIAEVGSNFDGDIERAKKLAKLAKDLGADCYKIQNFLAPKIVSNYGFRHLKVAHQAKWPKPVTEIYKDAEFPRDKVKELADYCSGIGIDFVSAPYDTEAVDLLEHVNVPAYKIGSGEIDNLPFLSYVAKTQKPILLSCGASTLEEVKRAVSTIEEARNTQIIILQCIVSYPSKIDQANLRVLETFQKTFPYPVGYSDHTIGVEGGGDDPLRGLTIPLAAVALGARVIEKHFTDDRKRVGPDHPFAIEPDEFNWMVGGIRAVERALGTPIKNITPIEKETYIIQRRGIYAHRNISLGEKFQESSLEFLRPAIGLRPPQISEILGKPASRNVQQGEPITRQDVVQ